MRKKAANYNSFGHANTIGNIHHNKFDNLTRQLKMFGPLQVWKHAVLLRARLVLQNGLEYLKSIYLKFVPIKLYTF